MRATACSAIRWVNGGRSMTAPPTISISTPPMPTTIMGPNTGSRCRPQEISTEAGTISWTRTPSSCMLGVGGADAGQHLLVCVFDRLVALEAEAQGAGVGLVRQAVGQDLERDLAV